MLFVHQIYKFDRSFGGTKLTNEIRKFRLFYERREKEREKTQPNDDDRNERSSKQANKERVLLCALIAYYESASEPNADFGVSDFSISEWSVHAKLRTIHKT